MKGLSLVVVLVFTPFARADFAAMVFDGKNKATSEIQNIKKLPNGGYRVTHSLPPVSVTNGGDLNINGKNHKLNPDMATTSACAMYLAEYARGLASDREIGEDLKHFNSLPSMRSVTLTEGDWVGANKLKDMYSENTGDTDHLPVPISMRLKGKPVPSSIEEMIQIQSMGEAAMEVFLPRSMLTVTYGQTLGSSGKPVPKKLPWQHYDGLFDHQIPKGSLSFEIGKASAKEHADFGDLLHLASFAALKEATILNKPLDEAFVYVHATDAARFRLYRGWGLKEVARGASDSKQRLMRAPLSELLQNTKFDPEKASERISLVKKYSDRPLSDQSAYVVGKSIQEMMSVNLDLRIAGAESTIRVDDRSPVFFKSAEVLMNAHGIKGNSSEMFKRDLRKIGSGYYKESRLETDVSILPEEIAPSQAEGNVFIQDLKPELAQKDPYYLLKVFAGTANWYSKRNAPFLGEGKSVSKDSVVFSVLTQSDYLAQQARVMGLSLKKVAVNDLTIASHDGDMGLRGSNKEVYSLSIPLDLIEKNWKPMMSQVEVKQGAAAVVHQMEKPVSD